MGLKIQRNIISYLVVALVLLTIVVPWEIILPTTYAQQSSTAQPPESQQILQVQGLGINPFIIEIDAEPGDTIEKSISLTNTTDKPLSFLASINDFVPNGTSGQPIFLPTNQDANPKYSLSKWVTVTRQPQFTIPPHASTKVDFAITIPADVEPGTHYGGILFGRPPDNPSSTGTAVQSKAGVIILVRLGHSSEQIAIENFKVQKTFYQITPIEFSTIIRNDGNVHSKAKGEITIRNMVGDQVIQVPINRDANIILPFNKREFISKWNPKFAFGRYTANAVIFYGSPKLELRAKTVFWVMPIKATIIAVLILLILAIIIYRIARRYNRYIINRSRNEN